MLAESERKGLAHLGYGKTITILDMIKMVYGELPPITHLPGNVFDIRFSQSPEPCEVVYGREDGMKRTMEWFKHEFNYA